MKAITWAVRNVPVSYKRWQLRTSALMEYSHWSRVFEYPWIMENGNFYLGQYVLDAAGGDAPLQAILSQHGCSVTNIDLEPCYKYISYGVDVQKGNLEKLPVRSGVFSRVLCVSVLEHTKNPLKIVRELWRVTAPGGRLLVTMDVANYARYNHIVDMNLASSLCKEFDLAVPPLPKDVLRKTLKEEESKRGEPKTVQLKVLCFYVDKAC